MHQTQYYFSKTVFPISSFQMYNFCTLVTFEHYQWVFTAKSVLSGHSKIDKTKGLKTIGSLMKIESIAECSLGAFCNTFDLH